MRGELLTLEGFGSFWVRGGQPPPHPWMSPHTVTGLLTGCTLDSSTSTSFTYPHSASSSHSSKGSHCLIWQKVAKKGRHRQYEKRVFFPFYHEKLYTRRLTFARLRSSPANALGNHIFRFRLPRTEC